MKKIAYAFTGLGIIILSFILYQLFVFPNQNNILHTMAAGSFGTDSDLTIPSRVGVRGTESYPFVILEIVPYEGVAEIGYMINGAEPVSLDLMSFDSPSGSTAAATMGFDVKWREEATFDIPEGDVDGTNESLGHWIASSNTTKQYGYFQKVSVGEGDFIQVKVGSQYTYQKSSDNSGTYRWIPYIINEYDSTKVTDHQANQVHTYRDRIIYKRHRNFFTHNHKFLQQTLKIPTDQIKNYHIQVITMTPTQLNNPVNYGWIDRADLINISPKEHVGGLSTIFEKYYPEKKIANPPKNFAENDLNWETIELILRKASQNNPFYAPVIFDVTIYDSDLSYSEHITVKKAYSDNVAVDNLSAKGHLSNVTKLYMIMQQMRPEKFVQDYMETGLVKGIPMKDSRGNVIYSGTVPFTVGYFVEAASAPVTSTTYYQKGKKDPAAVWNLYTLLPYHLFSSTHGYNWNNWDEGWNQIGITNYRISVEDIANRSVRNSFLSYNGNNSLNQIFDQGELSLTEYTKEAYAYYNRTSGTMTPAEAINYLLTKGSVIYDKDLIRILEIEPFNDFIWDGTSAPWSVINDNSNGTAYARAYYKKFFPNYTGKVSVTTLTSGEFIGKIEDLNKTYDMIVFGLRDGSTKEKGPFTRYNDTTLNNKVYLHNGDLIKQQNNKLLGLPGTNTGNTYRFSGNDITLLKLDELKDFMRSGKPILLDKGFYTDRYRTSVNSTKLAMDSYIYDLAYMNRKGQTPGALFYAEDTITTELEGLLGNMPLTLVFGNMAGTLPLGNQYPVVYRDKTKSEYASLSDSEIFINGHNNNFRTLQYQFYIKADSNPSSEYTVKLFIDINADGKYDEVIENVDNLTVVDGSGYNVMYNQLKAGVDYKITRKLEEDYYGVLPWKLEIRSNDNLAVRNSQINYCALKTANKLKLNILQITANSNNNVNLTNHTLFIQYINNLNDYKLNFKTWTVEQYINKVKDGSYRYILKDDDDNNGIVNPATIEASFDDDGDGYYDIDMVILGFADMYTDIGNDHALKNIEDFIEEGKTILFTHDTTSFVNRPKARSSSDNENNYYKDTDFWGYGLNRYFRNILGMDRFGATLSSADDRRSKEKDYASKNEAGTKLYNGYIQGYSNLILNRYADTAKKGNHPYVNFPTYESDFVTTKVSSVNHGQITKYPYEIDNNFTIAKTHAQYYQLDMEEEEMVVWYALSDDKNGKGLYSATPNDVRNNYYIYNKGNITYSGVGHSALDKPMEVKLFVNTMIAAYSATAKAAKIDIINRNSSTDVSGKSYVYVDYDIYNTDLAFGKDVKDNSGQYQQVKYRFIENNILFNKEVKLDYFEVKETVQADGSITKSDELISLTTRYVTNDNDVSEFKSGEEYYIMLPLSDLNDSNQSKTYKIRITIVYGKLGDKMMVTNKEFILVRRGLFDLD